MTKNSNSNTIGTTLPALPDWMVFPTLAKVFDSTPVRALAHMTEKYKEYQSQSTSGSASDRVQNKIIAQSYAHTCTLLQNLEEQRRYLLKEEATTETQKR